MDRSLSLSPPSLCFYIPFISASISFPLSLYHFSSLSLPPPISLPLSSAVIPVSPSSLSLVFFASLSLYICLYLSLPLSLYPFPPLSLLPPISLPLSSAVLPLSPPPLSLSLSLCLSAAPKSILHVSLLILLNPLCPFLKNITLLFKDPSIVTKNPNKNKNNNRLAAILSRNIINIINTNNIISD